MERITSIFNGDVQGVGFRFTTQRLAAGRPITGYVRNTDDGRVELVAEGSTRDIQSLIQDVQREMQSNITDVVQTPSPATGEFPDFTVRQW